MILINLFILIIITTIYSYNIDLKNPIIAKDNTDSYFGYSVLLHQSFLFVGAPKAEYLITRTDSKSVEQVGVVYKYNLINGNGEKIKPNAKNEFGIIKQINFNFIVLKDHGWFGAAMSIDEQTETLTVCAPRVTLKLFLSDNKFFTMQGICYSGDISSKFLSIEDRNFNSYDFRATDWYNPLNGFSVHYSHDKLIIGSPKHEIVGSVRVKGQRRPVLFSDDLFHDDTALFGYSIHSGYFFNKDEELIVAGAPGWNLVGQVVIMSLKLDPAKIIYKISGSKVGEYFGASLTACDMNNDGLDDLIIGAPHYGNDNGRVYIFLGNKKGFSEANFYLDGHVDSLFGYSLACGDLDADNFADLIVGAPWEDNGAVYIYNGETKIHQDNKMMYQKIEGNPSIKTFGFSLSPPVDVDSNGFPDIAVGAVKSNAAFVLLSRPVVETFLEIFSSPQSLHKNSTNFILNICIQHFEKKLPTRESFSLTVVIDGHLKRINQSEILFSYIFDWNEPSMETLCFNQTIYLLENIQNFIDPIAVFVNHTFQDEYISTDKSNTRELNAISVFN